MSSPLVADSATNVPESQENSVSGGPVICPRSNGCQQPPSVYKAVTQRGTLTSLRPPRCSSAWSHVKNQPSSLRAPAQATTLLVSVEPCSEPALVPPRARAGHHAARQRGAMFRTRRRAAPRPRRPPRCSSAWSHVQNQPSPRPAPAQATTLLVSVEPCSKPALAPPRARAGHHAARQRGAMFRTRRRPAPRPRRPPRCSSAWSHVQNQPSPRPAPAQATTLLVSVEPCSEPALVPPRDCRAFLTRWGPFRRSAALRYATWPSYLSNFREKGE